jgi:hypothetical protein
MSEEVKAEVAKVNPKDYELDKEKAVEIEKAFAPSIVERNILAKEFEVIAVAVIDEDVCEKAGTLRKKLVKVRTGIGKTHKVQKQFFLHAGRFVDAWKNAETLPIEQMEEKLSGIEKHYENIEAERVQKLNYDRAKILNDLGIEFIPAGLAQMETDVWDKYLWGCKVAKQEREESEAKVEAEWRAKEKEEEEDKERIRLENVKLKEEAAEREKEKAELQVFWDKKACKEAEERLAIEAKAKKEREAAEAKLKVERDERERLEAENAKRKREESKAAERKELDDAVEANRVADEKHQAKIKVGLVESFIGLGVDSEIAIKIVNVINDGAVPNLIINY